MRLSTPPYPETGSQGGSSVLILFSPGGVKW